MRILAKNFFREFSSCTYYLFHFHDNKIIIIIIIIVINKLQFIFFTWNRSLPDVVMSHIAQFLSPSDLGNMRRVNQYFRQLFSSPYFWQGIKISMPRISAKHGQLKIDLKVLETIKLRGIKELDLCRLYHNFDNDIRVILALLPQLEGLSIAATTAPKFRALCQAVSSGHLNVKKLALLNGPLRVEMQQRYTVQQSMFTDLFMQLPRLEEVHIGYENDKSGYWYKLQVR